jgi:phosphoglycolate phosphatase-like HAD superfamily hydrolase
MKLILFDIDGTLLATDGAGRAALRSAGADVFGIEEDLEGVAISGNTDVAIVHEILNKHGIPDSETNVNRYLGAYLAHLKQRLVQQPGDVLPGVGALLDAAAQDGSVVGLLTGNLKRGAQMKLATHHLWDRFSIGAFADDNRDRNMLGPIAKNARRRSFRPPSTNSSLLEILRATSPAGRQPMRWCWLSPPVDIPGKTWRPINQTICSMI